jgi:hypothetical protein
MLIDSQSPPCLGQTKWCQGQIFTDATSTSRSSGAFFRGFGSMHPYGIQLPSVFRLPSSVFRLRARARARSGSGAKRRACTRTKDRGTRDEGRKTRDERRKTRDERRGTKEITFIDLDAPSSFVEYKEQEPHADFESSRFATDQRPTSRWFAPHSA